MPTPPKTFTVLQSENKSHRTKAEMEMRKNGEASTLTGEKMREWAAVKNMRAAHAQFARMRKIYSRLQKDDAVYEAAINRYCILHAEVLGHEEKIRRIDEAWETAVEDPDVDPETVLSQTAIYTQAMARLEGFLMSRRKMLLDIEKESALTLASALRSIPKKPEGKAKSKMAEALARRKVE